MPKSILEKLEEVMPKEKEITEEHYCPNKDEWGMCPHYPKTDTWNTCRQQCIDSLPEVLRVIIEEIENMPIDTVEPVAHIISLLTTKK